MKKEIKSKESPLRYHFQLYVAGKEPNSQRAFEVLKKVGEKYLQGRFTLEVVDVTKNYEVALKNNILLAPTLIIKSPPPERKIIGSLNDMRKFLEILGIPEAEEVL